MAWDRREQGSVFPQAALTTLLNMSDQYLTNSALESHGCWPVLVTLVLWVAAGGIL